MSSDTHPVPPADQQGSLLEGRYELRRLLGRGGMSEVYEGHDQLLDRRVAIKLVSRDRSLDPDAIDRVRREARAVAALDHPNVIALHDLVIGERTTFLIMEYLDGPSVATLLRERHRLASREAREIAGRVCDGLAAAHRRGLVHRDVTPGNILLGTDGAVKLTDFGIAHGVAGAFVTATGQISGTPAYMSPEQVSGAEVDVRSDVYSLGCCLYLMLTGRPPFQNGTAVETASAHLREEPAPLRSIVADVPADLEAVVLRSLAKHPADRYQNAAALRAALVDDTTADRDRTVPIGAGDGMMPPRHVTLRMPPGTERTPVGRRRPAGDDELDDAPLPGGAARRLGIALIVLAVVALLAAAAFLTLA